MSAPTLSDFKLTAKDRESALWKRFHAHMANELAYLRVKNDAPEPIADTTVRRGQIALAKRILALSVEGGPEAGASDAEGAESQSGSVVAPIALE